MKYGNAVLQPLKEKQSQSDLLRCLKQLILANPFPVDYRWVSSHQDDHKKWSLLTIREHINVLVDKLAKLAFLAGITGRKFVDNNFPFEQLTVKTGGRRIAGSLRSVISKHWSATTAKEHFHFS